MSDKDKDKNKNTLRGQVGEEEELLLWKSLFPSYGYKCRYKYDDPQALRVEPLSSPLLLN
jgi:hypothetical protein